jgi:hypothetical protein
MTWKSYAAMSGATVLAGWLASTEPSNAPADVSGRASSGPRVARGSQTPVTSAAAASSPTDIELQAMRLQARLRTERDYSQPVRDPFRFAPRRAPAPPAQAERPVADVLPPLPVNLGPPAPQISLSGIAEDQVDGRAVRSAILSTPAGVLIVREGDEILGGYRVGRIESEAVELVPSGGGPATRLALK